MRITSKTENESESSFMYFSQTYKMISRAQFIYTFPHLSLCVFLLKKRKYNVWYLLLLAMCSIYIKLLFKSTIKFCAFSCLTDFSIHFPIPIAALRHHHQNTFSEQFGHSSSVTSHGALSSAFGADTHYFRSSSRAADGAAAAAACYNRSSSGRVTFASSSRRD